MLYKVQFTSLKTNGEWIKYGNKVKSMADEKFKTNHCKKQGNIHTQVEREVNKCKAKWNYEQIKS